MRSPSRLPRCFNRPVTKLTSAFVARKHRRRKERRRERLRRFVRQGAKAATGFAVLLRRWFLLMVTGLLFLGVGLVLFSPIVQVREIRVYRTDIRIDSEKVQRALMSIFGRHLLFLPGQEVSALVRQAIPDIADVAIGKQYPSRLTLTISLEPLIARLAIQNPDNTARASGSGTTQGDAFDELTVSGRYTQNPKSAGTETLPVIQIVDWGVRPTPGMRIISEDLLQSLYAAEEALEEQFGLTVSERILFIRAREFHLKTQEYTLWFDLKTPLEEHLARYKVFLASIPRAEVKAYVDLRLANSVVYH